MGRIKSLDGWRGIAILLVLIDHFKVASGAPRFSFVGQEGVTLFFVLSGFLITSTLIRELDRSNSVDLKAFYIRRFFRLQPCAWVYLAIYLFTHPTRFTVIDCSACLLFLRNFISVGSWASHFWSLSIEEQFYLFWPPVLVAFRKRALPIAGVVAIACAAWRFTHWPYIASPVAFLAYGMSTVLHADALLVGCVFGMLPRCRSKYIAIASSIAFLCFVAFWNNLSSLTEAVVIGLLISSTEEIEWRWLTNPVLTQLGLVSYSIYVWQQSILFSFPAVPVVRVVFAIGVGFASYYCIEKPMIRLGKRLAQKRPSLSPGVPAL